MRLLSPLLLFGGASFLLLLLWVGLLSLPLLLEGTALPSLSLGGVFGWGYFSLLFCWVVLLGPLRWVVLRYSLSPFVWCCLPSPPSLGGSLSKRKIKNIEKNEVKNKKRNKEKQRGKQKEETRKKKKLKSEFLNPIPDEKVHLAKDHHQQKNSPAWNSQ